MALEKSISPTSAGDEFQSVGIHLPRFVFTRDQLFRFFGGEAVMCLSVREWLLVVPKMDETGKAPQTALKGRRRY